MATLVPINSMGNIIREIPIDVSSEDYINEDGFFFRTIDGGLVRYVPVNNQDNEYIDQIFDAQQTFVVPVVCRKIISVITSPPSSAQEINIGFGL